MTIKLTPRTIAASLIAMTGLASLSPVQQAVVGVAALGALGAASPAMAQTGIPGIGVVVKKKPGNAAIIAPSDANGNVVLSGLEAGDYEVKLIGAEQAITVPVGRDGTLAITAWEDKGRQWVEPLRLTAAAPVRPTAFDVPRTFSLTPPVPCARSRPGVARNPVCQRATMNYIDVNTSSAEDIVRLAPTTSVEAAAFIVAERTKNGAFKDASDFANRTCPNVSIDFDLAPEQIGNLRIIPKSGDPKAAGWGCAPARLGEIPYVELFGKKHQYVGHVTLLR